MNNENKKLFVLLILGLIVHQQPVNSLVEKALQLASFAWDTFGILNTAHDTYNKFDSPSIGDVLDKTEEIIQSLDDQGAQIEEKLQTSMVMLLTRLPLMAEIADDIRLLNTFIVRIDELYADLKTYLETPELFEESETRYLTKAWISRDGDDIQGTISQMFSLIVPQRLGKLKKSLFVLLAQESRGNDINVCDTGAPPQQRLLELFNICMESEMRAFAMYGFGLYIDGYLDKSNYTVDIERAGEKFEARAKEYLRILRGTIALSGRLFRRCDPAGEHERGVSFYEFERFLQSFVVQESIFREDHQCPKSCEGYNQPTYPNFGCRGVGCESGPDKCSGRLTNCVSTNNNVVICGSSGTRRYEWFEYINGDSYGDKTMGCPEKTKNAYKMGSCSVCNCICVEDDPFSRSNNFISLREQLTNIDENMVATGLSLVIVKRILHIRVMQGKLEPQGVISKGSTSWVEPENIQYVEEKDKFVKKFKDDDDKNLIEDKDIAILTLEKRRINLDTINVPKKYVITGVRFRRIVKSNERNIQLEIHATSFDAGTGQLDTGSSMWFTPDDMPYAKTYFSKERTEYQSSGTRNPLKSMQTTIDSKPYTFIDVTWSSPEYDAAQTTIPLLDGLPVTSDPPTPLVGVGLHHKAKTGYGGFLTFVLEGIDQSIFVTMEP